MLNVVKYLCFPRIARFFALLKMTLFAVCHAERSEVSLFSRIARFFALLKMTFLQFVILSAAKYPFPTRVAIFFALLKMTFSQFVMLNAVKYLCFPRSTRFFLGRHTGLPLRFVIWKLFEFVSTNFGDCAFKDNQRHPAGWR